MIDLRQRLEFSDAPSGIYHSLPLLEKKGMARISRLPISLRILLESVLRNLDGQRIRAEDVETLANWQPDADRTAEVPFIVGRVLLQDFTGVPLLVDLAAMRSAVARRGGDMSVVQPMVPVDLVIDHSVQVDYFGRADALRLNMEIEFGRNSERYQFLKWGAQAFDNMRIVPPGFGICHQVNLEFLAPNVILASKKREAIIGRAVRSLRGFFLPKATQQSTIRKGFEHFLGTFRIEDFVVSKPFLDMF